MLSEIFDFAFNTQRSAIKPHPTCYKPIPMKTPVLILLFLLPLCFSRCEHGGENNPVPVSGKLTHVSDCKSNVSSSSSSLFPAEASAQAGVPVPHRSFSAGGGPSSLSSSQSCINYTYDKNLHRLTLTHINAGFNCCPDSITCDINITGSIIQITEKEASALCNCNCLYDLEMVITGLFEMPYNIRLSEPYAGEQAPLIFTIDLKQNPTGSYCVERGGYPWGMD